MTLYLFKQNDLNVEAIFGCSIGELIANHLSDTMKIKYRGLFYGFLRISPSVIRLIIDLCDLFCKENEFV